MTRLGALKALEKKTVANGHMSMDVVFGVFYDTGGVEEFMAAYDDGSLDAAMALHKAFLGGWVWDASKTIEGYRVRLEFPIGVMSSIAVSFECPARAWLIAILRALIAEEEAT